MASKVKTARIDNGFTVEPLSDGSVRYSGRGVGLGVVAAAILLVILFIPVSLIQGLILGVPRDFAGYTPLAVILTVLAVGGIEWLQRPRFVFTVTDNGIQIGNKLYPHDQISEVFIDNSKVKTGQPLVSGTVISGSGVAGSVGAAGGALAHGMSSLGASLGRAKAFRVNLRHGRKVVRLATCLDEARAIALFNALIKAEN